MMRTESAAVAEHGARVNCQRRSDEKVREELEGEATEEAWPSLVLACVPGSHNLSGVGQPVLPTCQRS